MLTEANTDLIIHIETHSVSKIVENLLTEEEAIIPIAASKLNYILRKWSETKTLC